MKARVIGEDRSQRACGDRWLYRAVEHFSQIRGDQVRASIACVARRHHRRRIRRPHGAGARHTREQHGIIMRNLRQHIAVATAVTMRAQRGKMRSFVWRQHALNDA